jgi:polyhydroxybutyrate depolymerase
MRASRVLALAGGLLFAACSAVGPAPTPTPSPIADFDVGGDRPVTVHVPPGIDPRAESPVLIMLHGYSSNGDGHESYMKLGPVAAARGMLYLHPTGTKNEKAEPFWNATDACCDIDGSNVDDSAYLAGLIDEIRTHVGVDSRRIYLVGHSNGGFMSYRMACDHADLVAAIVSLAGASFADPDACRPSEPVAILEIHGSLDDAVRMAGGNVDVVLPSGDLLADYPSTAASLGAWLTYDRCSGTPVETRDALDLDRTLGGATSPNETATFEYAGCAPGGAVELWLIEGGSHVPELSTDFATKVIDFLLAHPKPA